MTNFGLTKEKEGCRAGEVRSGYNVGPWGDDHANSYLSFGAFCPCTRSERANR